MLLTTMTKRRNPMTKKDDTILEKMQWLIDKFMEIEVIHKK